MARFLVIWAIYVSVPLISACTSLEVPAYLAMATQLVAGDQFRWHSSLPGCWPICSPHPWSMASCSVSSVIIGRSAAR